MWYSIVLHIVAALVRGVGAGAITFDGGLQVRYLVPPLFRLASCCVVAPLPSLLFYFAPLSLIALHFSAELLDVWY
jgi:hypothetical protein